MTAMVPVYGNDKVKIDITYGTGFTLAIAPTAGINRHVYLLIGWYNAPGAINYIRFDGSAMTLIANNNSYECNIALYEGVIDDTSSGSKNITTSWTTSRYYCAIAFTFAKGNAIGVNHATGADIGSVAITSTLNTNDIDTMVMVTIGTNNAGTGTGIATPSDTLILSTSNNGDNGPHGSSGYRDADTPTTTMTATRSNTSVGTAYGWVSFVIRANSTPPIVINPILMF